MGRGDGRRKKKKSKATSSEPNTRPNTEADGNGPTVEKGEDTPDPDTPDPTENMNEQQAESAAVRGIRGENVVHIFNSPELCPNSDPSDPNQFNFAALSLDPSDDKENAPKTPGKLGDSLLDGEFHGLEAIDRACRILYPFHEKNPVITSPAVKVWLGGALPLDYVKIFYHDGDLTELIVPHWHYISFGLSDLHGDGRVHVPSGRGYPSGFGFELSFRLKRERGETDPPQWPVKILNELAAYCFNTDFSKSLDLDSKSTKDNIRCKRFCEFDHIPWNQPLDADDTINKTSLSKIKHLILVEDPKLLDLDTPNGTLQFLQVVGIVEEEYLYTRAWTTFGVVDHLLDHIQVGPLLVTDMQRRASIFDLKPELRCNLRAKIEQDGSNLTNISAHIYWVDTKKRTVGTRDNVEDEFIDYIFTTDQEVLANFQDIEHVTIHIDSVAAEILPIMVKGRLMKSVTFVFDSPSCVIDKMRQSIYFIPHNFTGHGNTLVSQERPMRGEGGFLQIYCNQPLLEEMAQKFAIVERAREKKWKEPMVIWFLNLPLVITVHPDYRNVIKQHRIDKERGLNAATQSTNGTDMEKDLNAASQSTNGTDKEKGLNVATQSTNETGMEKGLNAASQSTNGTDKEKGLNTASQSTNETDKEKGLNTASQSTNGTDKEKGLNTASQSTNGTDKENGLNTASQSTNETDKEKGLNAASQSTNGTDKEKGLNAASQSTNETDKEKGLNTASQSTYETDKEKGFNAATQSTDGTDMEKDLNAASQSTNGTELPSLKSNQNTG